MWDKPGRYRNPCGSVIAMQALLRHSPCMVLRVRRQCIRLEGVVSNEVRTRGQLHKASLAIDRGDSLRTDMIEPSSWDFSPMHSPSYTKRTASLQPFKCF